MNKETYGLQESKGKILRREQWVLDDICIKLSAGKSIHPCLLHSLHITGIPKDKRNKHI